MFVRVVLNGNSTMTAELTTTRTSTPPEATRITKNNHQAMSVHMAERERASECNKVLFF